MEQFMNDSKVATCEHSWVDYKWGRKCATCGARQHFVGYSTSDLNVVLDELVTLRATQDKEHGGPAHDDTHSRGDWLSFISKFISRATSALLDSSGDGRSDYENCMLHVAALAVAAIQSSRRKRGV